MKRVAIAAPPRREVVAEWGFIILLGCASALSAFGMASVVPALPELGRALGAGPAQQQFVVSAYLLGLGLFQPMQGLLCDRFGRRPVLLIGFAVFIAGSLVAAATHSLLALTGARVLQALGVSVATVVSRAIVRDTHEPEAAGIALSFISTVMGIAPIIAPMAGGIVVDAAGWQAVFQMHAAMGALLLIWMVLQLRETRPAATQAMPLRELLAGFGTLLREPAFLAYTLTYGFVSGAAFLFITVGASVFATLFGMTPSHFGVFWATLSVSYMAGAACSGWAARRVGSERVLRTGTGLGVIGAVAILGAAVLTPPNLVLWAVALSLLIFANGLTAPLSLAGAVSEHAELAGVASGLSSALAMLLSMLCAVASGLVYHGDPTPNALLMVACCGGAWVAVRIAHARRSAAIR